MASFRLAAITSCCNCHARCLRKSSRLNAFKFNCEGALLAPPEKPPAVERGVIRLRRSRVMKFRRVFFLALASAVACRQGAVPDDRTTRGPAAPAGWAVVAPYDTGSEAARCANWAREQWRVTLTNR